MVPLGQISKTVCLRHPALQHKSAVPEDDELLEEELDELEEVPPEEELEELEDDEEVLEEVLLVDELRQEVST